MDDTAPEYILNSTSFSNLTNETETDEEIEYQDLLKLIRNLFIKDYYGQYFYSNFVITFIVCLLGYVTNFLNIIVFLRTQLSNPLNRLLLTLAIFDILMITTQISHIIHYFHGFRLYPFYEWYLYFIINTFFETTTSFVCNWLLVFIGVWVTSFIIRPLGLSRWYTTKTVTVITILLLCLGITLALPIFLQMTYHTFNFREHVLYEMTFSNITKAHNGLFLKIYWSALLLRALVPVLILTVITIILFWSLCRKCIQSTGVANKSSSSILNFKTTAMLCVLLMLFLISNLPDAFMVVIALASGGDEALGSEYNRATEIIRLFMLMNNAATFFVYYGLGVEFRQSFKKTFCCAKYESDDNSEGNEIGKLEEATI